MAHARRRAKRRGAQNDDRRYTVRGIRRETVDISKLSKALLGLAVAEAERQAQAEHATQTDTTAEPATTSQGQPRPGGVEDA
jgi:hypothetical protein